MTYKRTALSACNHCCLISTTSPVGAPLGFLGGHPDWLRQAQDGIWVDDGGCGVFSDKSKSEPGYRQGDSVRPIDRMELCVP